MEYRKEGNTIIARLARGELIVESITKLVKDEQIGGGFLVGIGAADEVEIAHYSVDDKKYSTKKFNQPLEITNITGSIAWFEAQPMVHCHATFSDPDMHCFGGHVVEARVSGTLEILLTVAHRLNKQVDETTGLKVFNLSQ